MYYPNKKIENLRTIWKIILNKNLKKKFYRNQ